MSDAATTQPTTPAAPPPAQQNVNIGTDAQLGLTGLWAKIGNMSVLTLFGIVFVWILRDNVDGNKAARAEDRQLFREMVREIREGHERDMRDKRDDDNRRTGELKGGLDAINGATNELIREIRGWRQDVQRKAAVPPGEE